MRDIVFKGSSFEDFTNWKFDDHKIFDRIVDLIEETRRTTFIGKGHPEPLKNNLKGFWSRRISSEHRLVYMVTSERVIIISCTYHYLKLT